MIGESMDSILYVPYYDCSLALAKNKLSCSYATLSSEFSTCSCIYIFFHKNKTLQGQKEKKSMGGQHTYTEEYQRMDSEIHY